MYRIFAIILWAALIILAVLSFFLWPERFTPVGIAATLSEFQREALLVFLVVSVVRGITLLPATPLVIAGTLAFPNESFTVLAISLFGIIASSAMIYWLSDALGISEFFETRKPEAVEKIRRRLEHPTGIAFVFLWAFFPLVPTDAVCYVAGSIRMSFLKFIIAIFAGELILCSVYIFSGSYIIDLLK